MRYRVLGAVGVDGAGLGPPKQRLVWATLLCRVGRVVSDDHLIDALWGEVPPRSAVANLRVYVTGLRKIVGDDVLQRKDGGYVVVPKPGQLDAAVFEEFLTQARVSRDPKEKKDQYEQAMALWRGSAFGSMAEHPAITHAAQALEELRLAAVEELAEVRLVLGEHAALTAELGGWVASHPLREGLHTQLMLALYRSGRQAEALEVYQRARQLLADELGLEPGPALQDLQQAILRSDPAYPEVAVESPDRPMAVPAELPADLAGFTGRTNELLQLHDRLLDGRRPVAISAISGAGGVGKSALAIHLGHQLIDQFPDGQLYVNLQGSTPKVKPLDPIDALGRLLRSLGVAPEAVPPDVDEAAALLRTCTHGRRLLIILDNACDTGQIRPLLPGSGTCAVVITSRRALSLDAVHHLALGLLTPDEARALLIAGIGCTGTDPEAAKDIVRLCGYLPLAISIAAARLNSRKTWNLAKLADRLMVEERRLSELEQGDRAVRACLEVSYSHLDYPHARAFRLCALPGGPDLESDAAAALLDLAEPDAEDLLDDLIDVGLLEGLAPGRYRYHDLIRLYAHEQAAYHDPPAEQDEALHRLLAWYTATARMARQSAERNQVLPSSFLPLRSSGRTFTDPRAAQEWLQHHSPHLVDSVEEAIRRPESLALAADQLYALEWLKYYGLDWAGLDHIVRDIAHAAVHHGDQRSEAIARYHLGTLYYTLSRPSEATTELRRAAELARAGDDRYLLAEIRHIEAVLNLAQGRLFDAISTGQEAADLYRACGNLKDEAFARSNLARCYQEAGRPDQARDTLDRAADAARQADNPIALAAVQYARGINQRDTGQCDMAITALTEALGLLRQAGNRAAEGNALYHLAETHRRAGQHRQAINFAAQCLELARDISDNYNTGRALTVLGRSHTAQSEHGQGRAHFEEAHRVFVRLDAPEADDVHRLLTS
ncbi:tetratricopeptide repeat protein [Nonomuraea sp. K271]|uniref:AfsR/SARP family transcriptional regulator n=1 Tax=Nonomuraea sp. KC401 TaxID=1848324 RepID=UPI00148635F9|nr:BTAD domain-containing putative transcriptional regulator [Nonomuraea sp. KC401]NBE92327.1 tetratricopeptide repeat protein [Nonomuraea sp. K271]